jgi:hypothetical protein
MEIVVADAETRLGALDAALRERDAAVAEVRQLRAHMAASKTADARAQMEDLRRELLLTKAELELARLSRTSDD